MKIYENDSIEQKILKKLSESSKSTGEIVTALGYKKTEYHNVTPALNKLKSAGYIHGEVLKEKGRKGQPPTIYNIILELSTIKEILAKYPFIISDLQKNDKIILLAVETHFWLIDYKKINAEHDKRFEEEAGLDMCDKCLENLHEPTQCGFEDAQRQECLDLSKNPEPIIPVDPDEEALAKESRELLKRYADSVQNKLIVEFKNRLRMSPYLFRACITSTPEDLKQQLNKIYNLTLDAHIEKHPFDIFTIGNEPEAILRAYFDKIFETSVIYDIMNKEELAEAIKDVSEMNEHKAHILEDIESLDARAYVENPKSLKYEYEEVAEKPLHWIPKIDLKKIKQNLKLNNRLELNKFLKENQFSEEEIELSRLMVGGLFHGEENMRFEEITSGLKKKGATYSNTFVMNTLEKLRKTKRQDGNINPVMDTVDFGIRWYCLPTHIKSSLHTPSSTSSPPQQS